MKTLVKTRRRYTEQELIDNLRAVYRAAAPLHGTLSFFDGPSGRWHPLFLAVAEDLEIQLATPDTYYKRIGRDFLSQILFQEKE